MRVDETINHYLLGLRTRRLSLHTQLGYRKCLLALARLLADLYEVTDLERVAVLHLRQCVEHLLNVPLEGGKGRPPVNGLTLSTSSVRTYIRRWKTFFGWCFKEELLEKDPSVRLEYPQTEERVMDVFSEIQIEEMLSVFDLSTEAGFRDYVIVLLMLDTGLRRAEVVTLRIDGVHETYIEVFGKGRVERQIGIHPQISNLLWKYIHKYRRPRNPDEPFLFLSVGNGHAGLPFGRGGMNALMERLKAATGLDEAHLHVFRHTFACMYLEEGGDLFSLSRELGHKNIKTTERYLKSFTSKKARIHHNDHSPINRIKLRSHRRGKKGNKKSKGEV